MYRYLTQTHADTQIHPYCNIIQPAEKKKKRNYNQHTMQVAQGNFSPLVFSIYRDMAAECQAFYSRLSELLSEKCDIHKSVMTRWIRSKLCFKLLKS